MSEKTLTLNCDLAPEDVAEIKEIIEHYIAQKRKIAEEARGRKVALVAGFLENAVKKNSQCGCSDMQLWEAYSKWTRLQEEEPVTGAVSLTMQEFVDIIQTLHKKVIVFVRGKNKRHIIYVGLEV